MIPRLNVMPNKRQAAGPPSPAGLHAVAHGYKARRLSLAGADARARCSRSGQ